MRVELHDDDDGEVFTASLPPDQSGRLSTALHLMESVLLAAGYSFDAGTLSVTCTLSTGEEIQHRSWDHYDAKA